MATKVPKTFIKSIDPSQIDSGGATSGQVLTYNGSTWLASNLSANGFTASLSSNGYQMFPSGIIAQWGTFTSDGSINLGSPQVVTLPIKFPNSIFYANVSHDGGNSGAVEGSWIDWTTTNKTTLSTLGIYTNYVGICKFIAIGS